MDGCLWLDNWSTLWVWKPPSEQWQDTATEILNAAIPPPPNRSACHGVEQSCGISAAHSSRSPAEGWRTMWMPCCCIYSLFTAGLHILIDGHQHVFIVTNHVVILRCNILHTCYLPCLTANIHHLSLLCSSFSSYLVHAVCYFCAFVTTLFAICWSIDRSVHSELFSVFQQVVYHSCDVVSVCIVCNRIFFFFHFHVFPCRHHRTNLSDCVCVCVGGCEGVNVLQDVFRQIVYTKGVWPADCGVKNVWLETQETRCVTECRAAPLVDEVVALEM